MVEKQLKVIIDAEAKRLLREAYEYIRRDSFQNAEKVKAAILSSIKELIKTLSIMRRTNTVWTMTLFTGLMKFTGTGLAIMYLRKKSG
jgi:plasmid stabilization system protein ParE